MSGDHAPTYLVGLHSGSPRDPSGVKRRRPLFWLALAFALGIWADDAWAPSFGALGGTVLAALLGGLALVLFTPRDEGSSRTRLARLRMAAALCAALLGGACCHALQLRFPPAQDASRRTPDRPALAWLEATVVEVRRAVPSETWAGREAWTVDLNQLGANPASLAPASGRVQLSIADESAQGAVHEGDVVRMLVRLEAPAPATLPAGFDAASYLARQGIRRVGEPAADRIEVIGSAPWWRADLWLRRASGTLAERTRERFDPATAALLDALLLGRREGLQPQDREAFAAAGTAHLLAISGLHVQAIAVLLWWLFAALGWPRRRSAAAVIAFALGYAALCGLQAPVVRAALMIGLFAGAWIVRRSPDPLTTLAAAALAILCVRPGELFLAGFQLTFLAVLALCTLYPSIETAWRAWRKIPEGWIVDPDEKAALRLRRRLRQALFVSFAAWVGTAPVVAWHMGRLAPWTLVTNFVSVPLALLGLACGAAALILGGTLGGVLTLPLALLLGFTRKFAALPGASIDLPEPALPLVAVYAAILALAWAERGRYATFPRLAALLPASLVMLAATALFVRPPAAPRMTVLDLPAGRAALVETPTGQAALIDCGAEGQGRRLAECLQRQGVRELALLVITEDSPEACGGAAELVRRVPVRRAVLARTVAPSMLLRDLRAQLEAQGVAWEALPKEGALAGPGEVRWTFASDAAPGALPGAGSEALCVRVALGGTSVLLAQARSEASLGRLLNSTRRDALRAEVLRVTPGVGGQWPASMERLVAACGARTLIAGQGGSYPEEGGGVNLAALTMQEGLRLLSTARAGSLRLGDGPRGEVYAYREGAWKELP